MNPHPAASPALGQMAAHRQMVIMEQMLMLPASPQMPKKNIPKVTSQTEDEVVIDFTDTEKA